MTQSYPTRGGKPTNTYFSTTVPEKSFVGGSFACVKDGGGSIIRTANSLGECGWWMSCYPVVADGVDVDNVQYVHHGSGASARQRNSATLNNTIRIIIRIVVS